MSELDRMLADPDGYYADAMTRARTERLADEKMRRDLNAAETRRIIRKGMSEVGRLMLWCAAAYGALSLVADLPA